MKRDEHLLLKILCWLRDRADGSKLFDPPECQAFAANVVNYHCELLLERGLADGVAIPVGDRSMKVRLRQVTDRGHDYIEANSE